MIPKHARFVKTIDGPDRHSYNRHVPKRRKERILCQCGCNREVARSAASGARFYSVQCVRDYEYRRYIERWLRGLETGNRGLVQVSNHVRRYLIEKHGEQCQRCGWNERNLATGRIPITVSHINGDWSDSREENLELLCPNCHSLTPTYGALNRGNGRPRVRREITIPTSAHTTR
jgi:hypothetical protein